MDVAKLGLTLTLPLVALGLMSCSAKGASLADGVAAYSHNQVAEAERIFRRVSDDRSAPPHDRAAALREIARIAWLIDGNRQGALQALDRAYAVGEHCEAVRLRARILHDAEQANSLLSQLGAWLPLCTETQAQDEIRYYAADSLLGAADGSPSRDAALSRASDLLAAIGADDRTELHVATARLDLALQQAHPAAAIDAWNGYYWLTEANGPPALASFDPAERFARGLAAGASLHNQLLLVDLLMRAGFARQAERLARRWNLASRAGADPLWRKASTYLRERQKLESILLASNRRVARGGRSADLRAAFHSAEAALAAAAGIKGEQRAEIAKAYGLYGMVGRTGNFESIHLGHLVQSERRPIDQYGRHAEVSYVVIDNMISNGYESWLWDGAATDGGWTEPGPTIVQARPGYTDAPVNAWLLVANPRHRQEYLARGKALEAQDVTALRSADVAYLPGLAHRLNLELAYQVLARARTIAGKDSDLHRAFLAEYWRANLQQSIFIHEGRHALDQRIFPNRQAGQPELEYRAKLSELALSDYPRLALANIDGATIGSDNEHGIANRRIMSAYASWIRSHRHQVKGYDPASPPLAQLDRLSDDQMRSIARALDPFARKAAAAQAGD